MISFLPIIFYDRNTNLTANSILNFFFLVSVFRFVLLCFDFERQFAADVEKKLEMENFRPFNWHCFVCDCIVPGNPVKERCDELILKARSTTAIICCRFISMQFIPLREKIIKEESKLRQVKSINLSDI